VEKEHRDKVAEVLAAGRTSAADVRAALEAASMLLATHGFQEEFKSTLVELGARADRHATGRLAELYNLPPSVLWRMKPLAEYPDLPMDGYRAQDVFHRINVNYPGLQLISEDPYIIICQDFFSPAECQRLINYFSLSGEQKASATYEAQTELRTSTTVIPNEDELMLLRDRIATLTRCGTDHLEPTKITRYGQGEFFRRHQDVKGDLANFNLNQLVSDGEPHFIPDVHCTVFVYLNDVSAVGSTRWITEDNVDRLFELTIPKLGEKLGKAFPDLPRARKPAVDLRVAPKAGMAVMHFPCTSMDYGCLVDPLSTHEGEQAIQPKFIVQQFIKARPLAESLSIKQRLMSKIQRARE